MCSFRFLAKHSLMVLERGVPEVTTEFSSLSLDAVEGWRIVQVSECCVSVCGSSGGRRSISRVGL